MKTRGFTIVEWITVVALCLVLSGAVISAFVLIANTGVSAQQPTTNYEKTLTLYDTPVVEASPDNVSALISKESAPKTLTVQTSWVLRMNTEDTCNKAMHAALDRANFERIASPTFWQSGYAYRLRHDQWAIKDGVLCITGKDGKKILFSGDFVLVQE